MKKILENIQILLKLASKADSAGLFDVADDARNSLIKIAQSQAPGSAYSYFDPTGIPPALYSIIANLNYRLNNLDTKIQQQSQQQGSDKQKNPQQNLEAQQAVLQNQNTITPSTMNYIQTPGSTPAPIEIDDGEINV